VATANVIVRVGARPVFVDVGLDTRNLDLDQVEAAITPRTRAIMPVHFAGLPVDMDRMLAIATKHGLRVIEDAAHAIGTEWHGRRVGSFGDLAVFSFHPNKNLTTIEGGAIAGGSASEVEAIERLRFHGLKRLGTDAFEVLEPSGKANMPDVNACIGLAQLPRLHQFNETRRALAGLYFEQWDGEQRDEAPVRLPARGDSGHSWHLFAPLLPVEKRSINRQAFIKAMERRRIGVGVHYPAIHLFSAYRAMGYREGQFPHAERVGRETVTLPLFPAMSAQDVDRVVQAVEPALSEAVS
jgi:dTDP-4-amino-4,6-dideoxygalactose transaminase